MSNWIAQKQFSVPPTLSLRTVFSDIFAPNSHIDNGTIRKVIAVEDNYNGPDAYVYDDSLSGDGCSAAYERNANQTDYVLYCRTSNGSPYVPVQSINDHYFDSAELCLRLMSSGSNPTPQDSYVSIYDLVKLDVAQIFAKDPSGLSPYIQLAFRVAAVTYAMSCIQLRLVEIHVRDISHFNEEMESISEAYRVLSEINQQLCSFDSQYCNDDPDKKISNAVDNLSTASLPSKVFSFFTRRDLVDDSLLAGVITDQNKISELVNEYEAYHDALVSADISGTTPPNTFVPNLFKAWTQFSALVRHYDVFFNVGPPVDSGQATKEERKKFAESLKLEGVVQDMMFQELWGSGASVFCNAWERNLTFNLNKVQPDDYWMVIPIRYWSMNAASLGYESFWDNLAIRPSNDDLRGLQDLENDLEWQYNTDWDLDWHSVPYGLFCDGLFSCAAKYRIANNPAMEDAAYGKATNYLNNWSTYPEHDTVDGMVNEYVQNGKKEFFFGSKDGSGLLNFNWNFTSFDEEIEVNPGWPYFKNNIVYPIKNPGWFQADAQIPTPDDWTKVCYTSPYDSRYWQRVKDMPPGFPCPASDVLPPGDLQDYWCFDSRVQARDQSRGPFVQFDWDGVPEDLVHCDGKDPNMCKYFVDFNCDNLSQSSRMVDQYYYFDPVSLGGAERESHIPIVSRDYPDYSFRIFQSGGAPKNSNDIEHSVAQGMQSTWSSGGSNSVQLLPPECFSGNGFSPMFHDICTRIALGTDQDDPPGKITFNIKWGNGSAAEGTTFIVSKIQVGNAQYVNPCAQYLSGNECVGVTADGLQMQTYSSVPDFWPIPLEMSGGVPSKWSYLLDSSTCPLADKLRLGSSHVNCWMDVLRAYEDQISAENSRKTNEVQRFLTLCQQTIGLAASFQKAIKQGMDATNGDIR